MTTVSGGAEDADAAGGLFDDGEDEQPGPGECSGFEEVGREGGVCLAVQESGPGLLGAGAPVRCRSFVALVVVILALVGLSSALPSAVAQEQSSCGRAAQDYVGATYVGTSIRTTGAVSITFTFDTVSWVTVRSPEGLSQRQWFFDGHGITVRTPPALYLLTTRVCDGLGDRMPSMVGGVMEWENMEVYPFTLYRRL